MFLKTILFGKVRVSAASAPPGEKGARTRPTASEAGPEGANRKFATGGDPFKSGSWLKLLVIREFFLF